MRKTDSIVLKVFIYGLPIAVLMGVFASFINPDTITSQPWMIAKLYNFSGLIFGLWMLFSLYLSMRLIFSSSFREEVLSKITFMRERDEREALFTGRATKNVFLSTIAVLIFILCLTVFTVSIHRISPEKAINGKTGTISLGIGFRLWDESWQESRSKSSDTTDTHLNSNGFDYQGLPLSKTGLILFLHSVADRRIHALHASPPEITNASLAESSFALFRRGKQSKTKSTNIFRG